MLRARAVDFEAAAERTSFTRLWPPGDFVLQVQNRLQIDAMDWFEAGQPVRPEEGSRCDGLQ